MQAMEKIVFLGDGSWGTTLAVYLARRGFPVVLWGAFEDNVLAMIRDRENKKFLPGVPFPDGLVPMSDLKNALVGASIVVLSTPSQYLRGLLRQVRSYLGSAPLKRGSGPRRIFLSVVKGIETGSLFRMSELIEAELGPVPLAVMSGPTIATEVAAGIPSSAVIASRSRRVAARLQSIFNSETFRIYTNTDLVGVELGGSLKNVIAIACGVCDGLGFGTNTKSAILARGLAEMARLGTALGARPRTFAGLTGLGDLVTTCFSPRSRNRHVGEELGRGANIRDILNGMVMVAEGVETAKAVERLAKREGIDMPISHQVYRLLFRHIPPKRAVLDLMTRKMKAE